MSAVSREAVTARSHDLVIIGGGLAGLTLAFTDPDTRATSSTAMAYISVSPPAPSYSSG